MSFQDVGARELRPERNNSYREGANTQDTVRQESRQDCGPGQLEDLFLTLALNEAENHGKLE